jgi:glutathione S-transferase
MDSSVILEYLERLVPPERRLTPEAVETHAQSQRIIGLALAACEKTVQIVYEHNLRPAEKRHQPWLDRVTGQLTAAYRLLEAAMPSGDTWLFGTAPLQADITTAVAWSFSQSTVANIVPAADYPALARFAARAESLRAFRAVRSE